MERHEWMVKRCSQEARGCCRWNLYKKDGSIAIMILIGSGIVQNGTIESQLFVRKLGDFAIVHHIELFLYFMT